MKNKIFGIVLLVFTLLIPVDLQAQCGSTNTAFNSGETISYDLYFNWKFVWKKVGTASWNVTRTTYSGKPAYKTYLITRGSQQSDRYFVMRDTLTTYTDLNLVPLFYTKHAKEGKDYRVEEVWYSYPNRQCSVKMRYRKNNRPAQNSTFSSKYCAYDMLSMMLRARSFNAGTMKEGQRVNFILAEGKHCEWRQLIYKGKKTIKMENSNNRYRCLVFSYVEKEGGKEKTIVTFYVTDDANHLPVRLDLNLRFGTAKAYMRGATGLRHPLTSKV